MNEDIMKKLLIGLIALGSISTFASSELLNFAFDSEGKCRSMDQTGTPVGNIEYIVKYCNR
jgi:hypothetical protein